MSKKNNKEYLFNLVDTPGHVDFANEVARSLEACQSVVLLVDANQGVEAQTYANFYLAFMKDLVIIPVLNKIDLKNAKPELVEEQINKLFDIQKKDVLRVRKYVISMFLQYVSSQNCAISPVNLLQVSAKMGTGIEELLEAIIERAPPPPSKRDAPLKALLFDSWFHDYKGVICLLYIQDGEIKEGDVICSHETSNCYTVNCVGIVRPTEFETGIL